VTLLSTWSPSSPSHAVIVAIAQKRLDGLRSGQQCPLQVTQIEGYKGLVFRPSSFSSSSSATLLLPIPLLFCCQAVI